MGRDVTACENCVSGGVRGVCDVDGEVGVGGLWEGEGRERKGRKRLSIGRGGMRDEGW